MQAKVMLLAVFLLSLLTAVTPAQSQSVSPQCIEEVETICGHIQPGSGRIQRCFDANINKFSPVCQTQLTEGKADAAAGISQSRSRKELKESTELTEPTERKEPTDRKADAITLTNAAIVELTDPPGLGKRTTVDPNKRWGSDVGVIKSATAKLQEALSKADGNARAQHLLRLAVDYGKTEQHKEARLAAQGALLNLCRLPIKPMRHATPRRSTAATPHRRALSAAPPIWPHRSSGAG